LTGAANRATLPDNVGLSVGRLISATQRERRRADRWTAMTPGYDACLSLTSPRVNRRCCLATAGARAPAASVDKRLAAAR